MISIKLKFSKGDAFAMQRVADEIAGVERELCHQVQSQVKLVADIGTHTLQSGGKRLRPAFVVLAARATGLPFDAERCRKLAACMEMIHMATLIHDDVIDHAATRRGKTTASALYGNTESILSGDVLLSKAMSILAQDGDIEIIRTVSSAVVELAEGEVRELEVRGKFDLTEEEHIEILRMKTASFIQCCCEIGALAAGAPATVRDSLGSYGHHVGLAFQIVDDLLDYRGDKRDTGKAVGGDFREGCATLPLIYLLETLSSDERQMARSQFGQGVSHADLLTICGWMEQRGVYSRAEQKAWKHIDQALEALSHLPDNPDVVLLSEVADFVIEREG
jgi:octaprenyl-diphosphate synthase